MKKGGITPRSTRCYKCHGTLFEDEEWKPPQGFDQHLHRFRHTSAFKQRTCGQVTYKLILNLPRSGYVQQTDHLLTPPQ